MYSQIILNKTIRSIWRNKSSYMACIIVLSLGILVFVSILSILSQIDSGIADYYEVNSFGDAFASVSAMPRAEVKKLEGIKGISAAEGVLTKTYKVVAENSDDIITVKLIGVDTDNEKIINRFSYTGVGLKSNQHILLGKAFFEAHGYKEGDSITLQINGKNEEYIIGGIAESPEYISVVAETKLFPDEKTYTFGFVLEEGLESATSMQGMVTEVSLLFDKGAGLARESMFEDLRQTLEEELSSFGLLQLVERKNQRSHYYIMDEISQMSVIGTLLPGIFITIAVVMIYIMLKRIIEQERVQIGTLKAFGFGNMRIVAGYLPIGVAVGLLGFLLGLVFSMPFGVNMYSIYKNMYSLPDPSFKVSTEICAYGLGISLLTGIAAILMGTRTVLKIQPAEAMRGAAPETGGTGFNIHGKALTLIFNQTGLMAIRGLLRNRSRSILIILSILSAFTVINVIYAMGEACNTTIVEQPLLTERYHLRAALDKAKKEEQIVQEALKVEGVVAAEGLLTMPVELVSQNLKEKAVINGLKPNSELIKIRSTDNLYHNPDETGLILNTKIAHKLGVKAKDIIEIKSPYLKENAKVVVAKVIEEAIGPGCYMDIRALSSLFYGRGIMANNLLIKTEGQKIAAVQRWLKTLPAVEGITNQENSFEAKRRMLESLLFMVYCFIVMSFFMGFGAIYNVSKISLAEKKRSLATMRILGYTIQEAAAINSFEQWITLVIGILLGFLPSLLLKDYIASLFENDFFTLKINLSLSSTVVGAVCCCMSVYLSGLNGAREINRYELSEVLRAS